MRRALPVSPCLVLVAAWLAACSGNGEGLDENGRPLNGGGGSGGALIADFQSIQDHVFTPICTQCHAGAGAPQGLDLSQGKSYGNLVNVPSNEVPSFLRVAPGDPNNSYLIQKLEGTAAVGQQMPDGCPVTRPCLDSDTIAVIRQWIANGAAPPGAADSMEGAR
ncbi:MAG: hypothetical protein QJR02_06850 [Sinobacteraceae bacterium]|nr:hypothetical protein [Nevskiaceae bacterium]